MNNLITTDIERLDDRKDETGESKINLAYLRSSCHAPFPFLIVDTNHPFSVGYSIYLKTNHSAFPEHMRCSDEEMELCLGKENKCEALFASFEDNKAHCIFIPSICGESILRVVELVIHEVSHLVDSIFELTRVTPCTETRAYMMDWLCGLILSNVHLFNERRIDHDNIM